MHLYHSRWHELSDEHIENLFNKYLGGTTVSPFALLPELRRLEVATLEVIEDRHMSTIYLIRETGSIYQVMKSGTMYGHFYVWEYEQGDKEMVKHVYKSKPCVFVISERDNSHFIERLKSPKFLAEYNPKTKEIFNIEWTEGEPTQTSLISTLKKAKMFLLERVK